MEVQQYQLQKQGSLNEIGIVVPLKLSQLYTFHGSGTLTGPPDVPGKRDLGSISGIYFMDSHLILNLIKRIVRILFEILYAILFAFYSVWSVKYFFPLSFGVALCVPCISSTLFS